MKDCTYVYNFENKLKKMRSNLTKNFYPYLKNKPLNLNFFFKLSKELVYLKL